MKIRLFTQDGGFVTEAVVPLFAPAPDVILWGTRVFISPAVDHVVRQSEWAAGDMAFVEAFAYALPTV